MSVDLVWTGALDGDAVARVREFLLAVQASDGRLEVPDGGGGLPAGLRDAAGVRHLLASEGGDLVGYVRLDTAGDAFGRQVAELFVHPAHRRRGIGAKLADELVEAAGAPAGRLCAWSHGDHPAAARLAARGGFARDRELLVLRAEVRANGWSAPAPGGVRLRTFVPGQDEQAVVDVNARAFDWHPEQGALTVSDLLATEAEEWFDPAGFFLAEGAGRRIVGFHWTRVHPAVPGRLGGEPAGEVYVVGVDPDAQGGGLGKWLTVAGLEYLRGLGLRQVILYVEGDNAPALAVYTKLGFRREELDVQYLR